MDLGLSGRTVVITGATGGIGMACAEGFAAEGSRLVLVARTQDRLDRAAAALEEKFGCAVLTVAADMTSAADVSRLQADVMAKCGGADILVLNTGRPPLNLREVIDETDEDRWAHAHEVQLRSAVRVASALVPAMIEKGWGRVVGITSASVKQPMPHHGLSTIYRSGFTAYLKHLANEIATSGVTVNWVAPASVGTESFLANWQASERIKMVPMRRLGTTEELASAVLYFASKGASFVTGVHLPMDGGMTASLT